MRNFSDGHAAIYTMRPDGTHQQPLKRTQANGPAFSPSGRRIAFDSFRHGNADIYVMGADGSHERRLTHDAGDDIYPAFSPSGRKLSSRAPATARSRST